MAMSFPGSPSVDQVYTYNGASYKWDGTSWVFYANADAVTKTYVDAVVRNPQTASYTLVLADAGALVEMNVASANNLTVPPNSSVAFPIGTTIDVVQYGAGQTTIVAGAGVTIRSSGSKLKITGQYSSASLYKKGTDEWILVGDISA